MKKRFYSILLIFTLIISLIPSNCISYAEEKNYLDEYKSFKENFGLTRDELEDLMDDVVGIITAISEDRIDNPYEREIKNALEKLESKKDGEESIQILINNGFIHKDYKTNENYDGIENVLNAANKVIYGNAIAGNDYKGKKLEALINEIKSDTGGISKNTKDDIATAYEYIYDNLPTEVTGKDFKEYGNTNKEKAKKLLELAKFVFTQDDELVAGTEDIIKFTLPSDYINKANEFLADGVSKPIVLTEKHENAIEVFLDIFAQRINENNKAAQVINIAKKLKMCNYHQHIYEGGIELDFGNVDFNGIIDVETIEDKELKKYFENISGIESTGPVVNFTFTDDNGNNIHEFEKPVALVLPVKDGEYTSMPSIFYYNEGSKKWEYQETIKTEDGKVKAYVNHFSIYGVLKDEIAPTISNIESTSTQNSITLTISAEDNDAINHYLIKDIPNNKIYKIAKNTTNEYKITGLSSGTQYTYQVKAVDNVGNESDIKEVKVTTASGGSGGSGGSSGSDDDNSEIDISDDSIDIKTDGGTTIADVKGKDLEKLVDKALDEKEVTINIDLSNIDKDVEVSLPVKSLKKLKGKDVKVVVHTKQIEVNIPLENLDLNKESDMKLDIKEVKVDEVKSSMDNGDTKVLKAIDINLFQGDTNIGKNFSKKVKVGINISDLNINKDKSVVVRINENNTEIVGGKVKNKRYMQILSTLVSMQ